jgi:hypothetical protein
VSFSVVSKRFRHPAVTSQRRQVTEEQKNHALERANEFKSRNPFTVQVMMESYVCWIFHGNVNYFPMLFHLYCKEVHGTMAKGH